MKKAIIPLMAMLAMTGCYSVPDGTDFTMTIARDYRSVADCAWLEFRRKSDWSRDNLDSMKRVEFSFGNSSSTAGRIDIEEVSPGKTRVASHMPGAMWGKDYWSKQFEPIFKSCS